jgi:membrane protein implicated in regulation of membrane protease activity
MIWLLVGLVLCLIEFATPTAFIAFVLGISAILVALVAPWLPLGLQVLLWMLLCSLGIWISRTLVSRRAAMNLDAREGETLTEIKAGQVGRVLYEGNSWAARCDDPEVTIPAHQRVYIVGRQGTTLLVFSEQVLRSLPE